MKRLVCIALLLLGWMNAPEVQASLRTVNYSGVVSFVDPSLAGGGIVFNDDLTGSYTFDTTIAASGDSDFAVFNALTELNVDVGSYLGMSSASAEIQQDGNTQPVRYAVVSRTSDGLTPLSINGYDLEAFAFRLDGGSSIPDALLLTENVQLSNFNSGLFFLIFRNNSNPDNPLLIFGEMTDVSTVPEPSTLAVWSVLGCVVGLGAWRRRGISGR